MASPRLLVDQPLAAGARIVLARDQAHYVVNVMRLKPGDAVRLFNGRDGEWAAELVEAGRRGAALVPERKLRPQQPASDLHLLFAPVKKSRTDFIVEKASELGVSAIRPVFTRRTQSERVNIERLSALAREAAEQCERLDRPEIRAAQKLDAALDAWEEADVGRRLLFCDEAEGGAATPWGAERAGAPQALAALAARRNEPAAPWAILIGPEGGFDPDERARLRASAFAISVALGPRVLRADTAAAAALTLWQATLGDWR